MIRWLVHWALTIGAIILTAYLIPGFDVASTGVAVIASIVLAILNTLVRPIIKLITLPINILTLGLFTLIVNGFMVWLTSQVVSGFVVSGFWNAVLVALVLSVFGVIINGLAGKERDRDED